MTKRSFFLFVVVAILFPVSGQGQTFNDALRYSMLTFGGTARNTALAGSMNALGADFSTLSQNPAGIALYRSNEVTFSPQLLNTNIESDFQGNIFTENNYDFIISNGGLVFHNEVGRSRARSKGTGWMSVNFGFGMNRLADFNQRMFFNGFNGQNSILENYAKQLTEAPKGERDNFNFVDPEAFSAFQAFLINPTDTTFSSFDDVAQVEQFGGVNQEGTIVTSGSLNEYVLSVGGNYENKLYVGGTVGIPVINFEKDFTYTESDRAGDSIPGFRSFTLRQNLETSGVGVNFKMGAIYRANDWVRLAGSIHTPSYFSLSDDFSSSVESNLDTASFSHESGEGEFDYNLVNPWRIQGGLGVIIQKNGFISFDYEFVDYSSANFEFPSEFQNEASRRNQTIQRALGTAHNFSVGGELKIDQFQLRAGYAFYSTPFDDEDFDGDQSRQVITGGLGFRAEEFFLDLTYRRDMSETTFAAYTLENQDVPRVDQDIDKNNFTATVGFRF